MEVVLFCERVAQTLATRQILPQLIDSAGSVDSNYRAACRGRSKDEFIAKLGVAIEEADEAQGWLLLLVDSNHADKAVAEKLVREADELISIFTASRKTAERNRNERKQIERQLQKSRRPR